ncbi:hypothetical protein Ancab_038898 [Ancistrocladus abbreviatus]
MEQRTNLGDGVDDGVHDSQRSNAKKVGALAPDKVAMVEARIAGWKGCQDGSFEGIVIVLYGSNVVSEHRLLWQVLRNMHIEDECSWLIIEDFNAFLLPLEKKGFEGANMEPCPNLVEFCSQVGVADLPEKGVHLTRCNQQDENAKI